MLYWCFSFFFFLYFYFLNFKIFNSYMRSQTWTPLPPPSPQHPSGSSPCTSSKHAVSCIRHRLAIQFLHDSIKRLFSPSSLSAIRVVSSAYLKLLIFLPAILIPACVSSSPEFLIMYSAYKLNKQGDNIQPWCTPFPIWNQSVVPCPVLTVASWPAYKFLKRQVRWSGIPISQNFPQFIVIHTVKVFG